jgi:hypothetical protein
VVRRRSGMSASPLPPPSPCCRPQPRWAASQDVHRSAVDLSHSAGRQLLLGGARIPGPFRRAIRWPTARGPGPSGAGQSQRDGTLEACNGLVLERAAKLHFAAAPTAIAKSCVTAPTSRCRLVVVPRRGELDPVVPRYWLPPAVAARIVTRERTGYRLRLDSLAAIPAAAVAICEPWLALASVRPCASAWRRMRAGQA